MNNRLPETSHIDELVNKVIHGDSHALAQVFEVHRDRLRRIVSFRIDPRLAARLDVEDVLQEAYLAAQERLQYVLKDAAGDLFVWLRLIVSQTLVDVHRRHLGASGRDAGRERVMRHESNADSTSFSMSSWLLGHLTSPSQAILKKELSDQLDEALRSMSDLDREVLVMRHFEELSNRETAAVLKISEQGASIRYVRALTRLQHILQAIPGFMDPRHSDSASGKPAAAAKPAKK